MVYSEQFTATDVWWLMGRWCTDMRLAVWVEAEPGLEWHAPGRSHSIIIQPLFSLLKKKAKCGQGSNHRFTPVGRPTRLLVSFSSRVSYSGTGPLLCTSYPSDEILEWVSNSYFLNGRTQTAEREKRSPLSVFRNLSHGAHKTWRRWNWQYCGCNTLWDVRNTKGRTKRKHTMQWLQFPLPLFQKL